MICFILYTKTVENKRRSQNDKTKCYSNKSYFAISATIFSHYSYAETSSNIESEDVDQKVNLQKLLTLSILKLNSVMKMKT